MTFMGDKTNVLIKCDNVETFRLAFGKGVGGTVVKKGLDCGILGL